MRNCAREQAAGGLAVNTKASNQRKEALIRLANDRLEERPMELIAEKVRAELDSKTLDWIEARAKAALLSHNGYMHVPPPVLLALIQAARKQEPGLG